MTVESKKKGRPAGAGAVSRKEDDRIMRGIQAGLSVAQIAAQIGRGRATVYNRIAAMRKQPLLPLHGADQ